MCRNITDSRKEYRKRPIVYETPNKMHKKRENGVKTGAKNWKKNPLTSPIKGLSRAFCQTLIKSIF